MKDKKIIYIILVVILISCAFLLGFFIKNNNANNNRDEGLAYILCSTNGTLNCIVRTSKDNSITISERAFYFF